MFRKMIFGRRSEKLPGPGQIPGNARAVQVADCEVILGGRIAACRGFLQESNPLRHVPRHPLATEVHDSEKMPGQGRPVPLSPQFRMGSGKIPFPVGPDPLGHPGGCRQSG